MIKNSILVCFLAMVMIACVSKKKFNDMSMKKSRLEVEKSDCNDSLMVTEAERNRLREQLALATVDIQSLLEDSTLKGNDLRRINRDYEDLSGMFEKLLKKHDKLQNFSATEADRLTRDLMKQEKELLDAKRQTEVLKQNLDTREARVKELEKILADKDRATEELKAKVSKALLSFNDKDLTVNIQNGKVYISLAEQLLFKSGSSEVDPKGMDALKKLGDVLKEQTDISIMVEGHTDDVPMNKATVGMKDNWDLSVLRATAITRLLVSNGANPKNIVPAGRADNVPIEKTKTPEARSRNRRTEIILTPNLDELLRLLDSK